MMVAQPDRVAEKVGKRIRLRSACGSRFLDEEENPLHRPRVDQLSSFQDTILELVGRTCYAALEIMHHTASSVSKL